jgi:aminopeptidase N
MRLSTPKIVLFASLSIIAMGAQSFAQGSGRVDGFTAPNATFHYAPDRDYDLMNVDVTLSVDWPTRSFGGHVVDTLAPLRDGLDHVNMDAGTNLKIGAVQLDGKTVQFEHDGKKLKIATGPIPKGKVVRIRVDYTSQNAAGRGFGQGGEGGWHWIQTRAGDPDRIGFWTQGETGSNSNWVPLWDYPNDFVTSETHTTVPADWTVIGNGNLISNTLNPDGKTRTFDWKLTIPHATYLLTLCGGPFDIGHGEWRGVPLWYVVPKGEGKYIPESFGHTPDMLSFYSDTVGYKFPWPKYAQDAMYDFGGGMENASATTLGENSLTDPKAGWYAMDSLNSHELGHQWFGDTVTCKDWGQIWLNESFATYMQIMYFEHSRGPNGYAREIENAEQAYFNEAQSYKRPVVTNFYSDPDVMFDEHTYPKGGVILHTLRHWLGDQAFFAGLKLYLNTHQHTPVETNDLCEALTDASGINCHPFFDQWLFKPGHPVIESTWKWDDGAKSVMLHVSQKQDTSDGTPIYNVKTAVAFFDGSHYETAPLNLNAKEQDFSFPRAAKPDAVLFDPDHNFLCERPVTHWDHSELLPIVRYAPNCIDRNLAMRQLLRNNPTDADIDAIVSVLKTDTSQSPAFESYFYLTNLKRESLRPFFESELKHADIARRVQGIEGLAALGATPQTRSQLISFINEDQPYAVVNVVMDSLRDWDLSANLDAIVKASHIESMRNVVRNHALGILAQSDLPIAHDAIVVDAAGATGWRKTTALVAIGPFEAKEPRAHAALLAALQDKDGAVLAAAIQGIRRSDDKSFVPELEKLKARTDLPQPELFGPLIDSTIKSIS